MISSKRPFKTVKVPPLSKNVARPLCVVIFWLNFFLLAHQSVTTVDLCEALRCSAALCVCVLELVLVLVLACKP